MLKLLIITILLLALCFLALGIRIWIKGKFADTEVGHNPNMRKLGIRCAKEEEIILWKKNNRNNPQSVFNCGSCVNCSNHSE
jgi:hypothetical protein